MKKIFYIVFCFIGCSINTMQMEPLDRLGSMRKKIIDLEMGYESAQQEDVEGLAPDQVIALIFQERQIEDKYEQAHLSLMVRELYERDDQRYHKLVGEVIPRRGQVGENKTEEVDKLYAGLMLIRESVNNTNALIQQQIDGGDEQDIIDTCRWRCDCCSNWAIGIISSIFSAAAGASIVIIVNGSMS